MLVKPIWRLDSKRQNQHVDEKFELATPKNQGFDIHQDILWNEFKIFITKAGGQYGGQPSRGKISILMRNLNLPSLKI